MNEQSDSSNKRLTAEKESENKRIRNSPTRTSRIPPPHAQLLLLEKIKLKYPSSNKDIKVSKVWFALWEAYCLDISTLIPPPMYLSHTDDPDTYIPLHQRAVFYFQNWYGATDEILQLNLSQVPSNNALFAKKKQPAIQRDHTTNISNNDDNNDKQLKFRIYIVDKPVGKFNCSFKLSADSTVASFQSSLLNALNKYSSGTNMELWLLNQENTSFINNLKSSPGFALSTTLLENSDRFAQKIDSSSIPFESTISSCLSQMSSNSNSNKEHTYLLAVEYLKKKSVLSSAPSASLTRRTLGLSGLQNLGNTCYMNSAIQCLSNTPQLTRYFLSGDYRHDINTSNALGLGGDLAKAYAKLLRDIWAPHASYRTRLSSLSPKEFKSTFERFNRHFVGYLQQDSQELLSFLLDGMHEDLNRVLDKPYMEIPDSDDHLTDEEIADRFWNYHKSRNDSVIVDLFQGQYKSRLVCEECKKVSITFDPFMHISLPLPVDKCEINIVYVPYLPSQRQIIMKIRLEKDASIGQLKEEIEKTMSPSSLSLQRDHSLLVVEIYDQRIQRIFREAEPVGAIKTSDNIHVYQLPCPSTEQNDKDWVVFPVYCSTTLDEENLPTSQFGAPIVLAIKTKKTNISNLYYTIVSHIERYCMLKLFEEDNAASSSPTVTDTSTLLHDHQPIHTTAERGHRTVPISDLFKIHLFEYRHVPEFFTFPVGKSQLQWCSSDEPIQQGRGVLIEWSTSKAKQFFGTDTSTSTSEINTDAWFDYDHKEKSSRNHSESSSNKSSRLITLDDCFDEFTGDEQLDNQDSWYCPRCKKYRRALKKIDIWKLPEIMIVHLKRFSQVRHWGNKVDTMIDFPLAELDMTHRVLGHQNESLVYDLYAVDNHYGDMGGGHYTAYAQNIDDLKWFEYNDSYVTAMSPKDVKTSAAYLLFYKRRR